LRKDISKASETSLSYEFHFEIYGVAIIHAHIFATLKGLAGEKSPSPPLLQKVRD
jgi:hypothetical protein